MMCKSGYMSGNIVDSKMDKSSLIHKKNNWNKGTR